MNSFLLFEIIQFLIGLTIVTISYILIARHRKPLLDHAFGEKNKVRKSFQSLSGMGYYLIFIPILLFGINTTPPIDNTVAKHIQRIIYFEGGLLFVIGILHLAIMALFSTKIKFEGN